MRKSIIILSIILILLIILGIYLYLTSDLKLESYVYRDKFTFVKNEEANGNITHTLIYPVGPNDNLIVYKIPFRYNPFELEKSIEIDSLVNEKIFSSKGFYITLDPDYDSKAVVAALILSNVLSTADYGVFKFPLEVAFTKEKSGYNRKIIDCKDATDDIKVIKLVLGMRNNVYSEDNCIIVEGDSYDGMIKSAERLSLRLLTSF